jgi:hypothetical protein
MIKRNEIHVMSREGKWVITQDGNNDFIYFADSVGAAVTKAREAARKTDATIIVHNRQFE